MLDKNVLISCIFIGLALLLYFFYWNRFIALILGLFIRIVYWNSEGSRIWFDIGLFHAQTVPLCILDLAQAQFTFLSLPDAYCSRMFVTIRATRPYES